MNERLPALLDRRLPKNGANSGSGSTFIVNLADDNLERESEGWLGAGWSSSEDGRENNLELSACSAISVAANKLTVY